MAEAIATRLWELERAYDDLLVGSRGRVVWDRAEERWYAATFFPEDADVARRLNALEQAQCDLLHASVSACGGPRNECE